MNNTHTRIIDSIFTNGHYLTVFKLDFYDDTTNHPRYIFQDAVYTHRAVLENRTLEYYPEYTPIYTSRAYDKYDDAFSGYQKLYDMYQNKTPDPTININSEADFGTEVSKIYFDEIAKEMINVDNIIFDEPTSNSSACVKINFYICKHGYTADVYIITHELTGTIASDIVDSNDNHKHTLGHGTFYIGYDAECGCSIGSDKSIYDEKDSDMNYDENTFDFIDEQGIPTDTVFRFIHRKALDIFAKYFINKANQEA